MNKDQKNPCSHGAGEKLHKYSTSQKVRVSVQTSPSLRERAEGARDGGRNAVLRWASRGAYQGGLNRHRMEMGELLRDVLEKKFKVVGTASTKAQRQETAWPGEMEEGVRAW